MVKKSPRLAEDYAWVSFRGPKSYIEDASGRIMADVGADAHGNCCKVWEVAGLENVCELDYRNHYFRPSRDTLMGIIFDYPELKFRALTPKLTKYSEGHREAYSKAGTSDCVDLTYRSDYEFDDYPKYDWWREVAAGAQVSKNAISPMSDADRKAMRDYQVKRVKEGLIITAYRSDDENAQIPASIGGEPVVTIGRKAFSEGFGSGFRLKSVSIPASVREIGDEAFFECVKLEQVRIEADPQLLAIGRNAFAMTLITSFTIPKGVERIGSGAFGDCPNLESVEVEVGNEHCEFVDGVLYAQRAKGLVSAFSVDGDYFAIPNTVETIGDFAFDKGVASHVFIPASVREIGERAFAVSFGPDSLREVTFEEGSRLEKVGGEAFSFCEKLRRVELPHGVSEVGENAFEGCKGLEFVSFPETVETFEKWFGDSCETPFCALGIALTDIKPRDYKEYAVIGFSIGMGEGASASPEIEKGYVRYIKGHAEQVLNVLGFDIDVLRWMIAHGCIAAKDAATLSKAAENRGLFEQASLLAECGAKPTAKTNGSRNRTKSDGSGAKVPSVADLKREWETKKLDDGTYAITTWKGESADVTVPSSIGKTITVAEVGDYAFAPHDGQDRPNKEAREHVLASVTVSEGVSGIGYHAFAFCRALKLVELPESIERFGKELFYGCDLDKLVIRSAAKIPAHALDKVAIDELYLSGRIGKQADTCVLSKVFLRKAMSDSDKKSVYSELRKLPNGDAIEFDEWE